MKSAIAALALGAAGANAFVTPNAVAGRVVTRSARQVYSSSCVSSSYLRGCVSQAFAYYGGVRCYHKFVYDLIEAVAPHVTYMHLTRCKFGMKGDMPGVWFDGVSGAGEGRSERTCAWRGLRPPSFTIAVSGHASQREAHSRETGHSISMQDDARLQHEGKPDGRGTGES